MKFYKTSMLDLDFKVELSRVGACASCNAAEIHGTKEYARDAVAKHRAISKDVRQSIATMLSRMDGYDECVEHAYRGVVSLRLDKHEVVGGSE